MIRRGDMKYIHCDSDLAQLYDLANDPWELENLADHPAYAVIADGFAQEVAQRWDSAAPARQGDGHSEKSFCAECGDAGRRIGALGLQPAV